MTLRKELLELAVASIVVVVLTTAAVSFYMLDTARVAFSEKYTMDDLDKVSLSYIIKNCFEKNSGGWYIKTSYLDRNDAENVKDLCAISKPCSVKIADVSGAEKREWVFSPEINVDPVTGEPMPSGFEESHTIYVNIGEDDKNIRIGEMIVSI